MSTRCTDVVSLNFTSRSDDSIDFQTDFRIGTTNIRLETITVNGKVVAIGVNDNLVWIHTGGVSELVCVDRFLRGPLGFAAHIPIITSKYLGGSGGKQAVGIREFFNEYCTFFAGGDDDVVGAGFFADFNG